MTERNYNNHVSNSAVIFTSLKDLSKLHNQILEKNWSSVCRQYSKSEDKNTEINFIAYKYKVSEKEVKKFLVDHGFKEHFLTE
jgi:hypothetical protein